MLKRMLAFFPNRYYVLHPALRKIAAILFFTAASINAWSQQNRLSEQAGKVTGIKKIASGYDLQLSNAWARITVYNASTVRIRVSKQKMADDFSFAIDDLQPRG